MKAIKLVSSLCLLQGANSLASFADCDSVLGPVTTDESALEKIKALHESKEWKFSSQCLETVLKRNFMDTATYLLTDEPSVGSESLLEVLQLKSFISYNGAFDRVKAHFFVSSRLHFTPLVINQLVHQAI